MTDLGCSLTRGEGRVTRSGTAGRDVQHLGRGVMSRRLAARPNAGTATSSAPVVIVVIVIVVVVEIFFLVALEVLFLVEQALLVLSHAAGQLRRLAGPHER